jgi:hypothetical protein
MHTILRSKYQKELEPMIDNLNRDIDMCNRKIAKRDEELEKIRDKMALLMVEHSQCAPEYKRLERYIDDLEQNVQRLMSQISAYKKLAEDNHLDASDIANNSQPVPQENKFEEEARFYQKRSRELAAEVARLQALLAKYEQDQDKNELRLNLDNVSPVHDSEGNSRRSHNYTPGDDRESSNSSFQIKKSVVKDSSLKSKDMSSKSKVLPSKQEVTTSAKEKNVRPEPDNVVQESQPHEENAPSLELLDDL